LSEANCPIWGTPTKVSAGFGAYQEIQSDRIGATYRITGSAGAMLRAWTDQDNAKRAALSQSILEAATNGAKLLISSEDLAPNSSLLQGRSVLENLRLLIKVIQWKFPRLGQDVYTHRSLNPQIPSEYAVSVGLPEEQKTGQTHLLIMKYFEAAQRRGLVDIDQFGIKLTFEAFQLTEDMAYSTKLSNSIFVAMWFGSEEVNSYFKNAVKPAIEAAGYQCVRIDESHHNERIDEQILSEIRKSKAVLVDITCGLSKPLGQWSESEKVGAPRGGVYFEAGFAVGLKIPIIWTLDKSIADIENVVHFDVRQFNQIRWDENHEENKLKLQARIEATLGRGDK
jgi:hypothetical protein